MKKLLIGSSALISAAAFSTAAFAQEAPEVSLSGQFDWAYVVQDTDGSGATDGVDGDDINAGNSGTHLIWDVNGTADNGLTYGARLDWRTASDSIDEHYISVGGGFGTVHLGADDSVIDNMAPGGESVLLGDFLWDGNNQPGSPSGAATAFATLAASTSDNPKIAYYSPSFSGLQIGVDYTPDSTEGNFTDGVQNGAQGSGAAFEGAINYSGDFSGVGVSAGIGYHAGEGGDSLQDDEGLMAGFTVSVAGFGLGVGYGDNGDTGCAPNANNCDGGGWWNVGASYSFGAAGVYAGWMQSEVTNSALGDDELDQYGFGVDYTIAEGLSAYGQYMIQDGDDASANTSGETDSLILGTTVSF
ncbi:MAG: porin [Marivibrio sp.]|uniref:porin n=1 Tax=Marivibrio sp. TaxID=2039719 RepID=UPI0032EE4647